MTPRPPETLAGHHATETFGCGVPLLDDWLKRRAYGDQADRASRTFVTCDRGRVVGYYTLASGGIVPPAPPRTARWRAEPIPVAILGRLALDCGYQRRGLGRAMVRDGALRVLQAASFTGVKAIVVDAISADSKAFYLALGFAASRLDPMTLIATLPDLRAALSA